MKYPTVFDTHAARISSAGLSASAGFSAFDTDWKRILNDGLSAFDTDSERNSTTSRENRFHFHSRTGRAASLIVLLFGITICAARANAQGGVSIWLGAGTVQEETRSVTAAAQLDIPVVPLALRPELFWVSPLEDDQSSALLLNGVFEFGLPGVSPYVIGGWGWHGLGESDIETGPSIGAGLRLGLSSFGVFGQIRHHQPLDANSVAIGVTF